MADLLRPVLPQDADDVVSLISINSVHPSPDTLTKLVKRLRALTLTLLPVEVDPASINDPTSRIITPRVISAYRAAAGDFIEALPYCLLRARAEFIWDANHNAADYGENRGRATACEVLARRIVHLAEPDRIRAIMSTRYQHRQIDGDESDMSSALEMAIDQHCTIFLSSSEAQEVVDALWTGDLIQINNKHNDIEYVPYDDTREHSFWGHFDPARLSVPRYQNIFRIAMWLLFLFVYSQAVREPLERLGDAHKFLDNWEIALYVLALSFIVEGMFCFYVLLRLVTWRVFSFWQVVAFVTDSLLLAAFILRIGGLLEEGDRETSLRLHSFQVLSCVSPFIWFVFDSFKLLTVFDGYKYVGTMQICVARMLKESGIFFALLSLLAIGFGQGLYALDAADGSAEPPSTIINVLVQALLQNPNYEKFAASPTGLLLFYLWNAVTVIVLLNVLISLFASAYSDIVDDAEAEYLAFFAGKTISMIRAPDSYVYPAPFNLVEVFLVAPFEFFPVIGLSDKHYAILNRYVMSFVFFIPLCFIALYESAFNRRKNSWMETWFRGIDEGEEDSPANRDPIVDDPNCPGLQISKVPFEELIKVFPNTEQSSEATILKEIVEVKKQMQVLLDKLENLPK
ncbi:calcium activated cation channel [Gymnopilus junonius]|uniref:Calcium activated cation channel n=1 Tax=Gymnopilus junonius TaxID=109634 RepID=A0A9P5P005_GYMJU|nr:calcium activated cation channel [Gymnopilus junonius]